MGREMAPRRRWQRGRAAIGEPQTKAEGGGALMLREQRGKVGWAGRLWQECQAEGRGTGRLDRGRRLGLNETGQPNTQRSRRQW